MCSGKRGLNVAWATKSALRWNTTKAPHRSSTTQLSFPPKIGGTLPPTFYPPQIEKQSSDLLYGLSADCDGRAGKGPQRGAASEGRDMVMWAANYDGAADDDAKDNDTRATTPASFFRQRLQRSQRRELGDCKIDDFKPLQHSRPSSRTNLDDARVVMHHVSIYASPGSPNKSIDAQKPMDTPPPKLLATAPPSAE
ncbi:hypothetical protein BDN72DRAFT_862199 [Pluteus cervinus]|uniref:Uncharacterized protein n=1 Tax=Pluteus cervinus TaxID=181527 RepID=A0ACD3ACB5_9AGAR|nr:hypothetical protein BDN72DRAFT_862199 [Pluteus cervinus]